MDRKVAGASAKSGQAFPNEVKKLLHIDSSILGSNSASRELTALIVSQIKEEHPEAQIIYRDLVLEPLPYMTLATLPGAHPISAKNDLRDDEERQIRHQSDRILEEFIACDMVVLGVPMYNFGIAAQLKAWIDMVVIPNKTFTYGPEGSVGLMKSKRAIVAMTRGGVYGLDSLPWSLEHGETYMRAILSFMGITDLEMIVAEGIAVDRKKAIAAARETIRQLAL